MDLPEPGQQPGQQSSQPTPQPALTVQLPNQQRLIGDLRQVIDNAEDLLKSTENCRSGAHETARGKLAQALAAAHDELERFEEAQVTRMIAATHEANARHGDSTGEARLLRAFH